jgi:endonuclease/exonuclease/phosphatase family metal-dependent hydrolase
VLCTVTPNALGLDIPNGNYSKNDPAYVRIMTWNVYQRLGDPFEPDTPWTESQIGSAVAAINLVIEALDPDVILLQEVGDIDHSVSYSSALAELQAWRNANRPGFSLFLSSDGGNIHNAILSRWSFGDLNGDGRSTTIDIPSLSSGPGGDWPQGGDGGIRGWTHAEINLPDGSYAGDLFVGCSHFKAYSGYDTERIRAAKNIAAYIQYALNTSDDPYDVVPDALQPPNALDSLTPVVWGGDFNVVDSWTPINAMRENNPSVADDGTDRDGGSSWRSDTAAAYNGTTHTWGGSSHLDWMFVQGALATVDAAFVFDTGRMPYNGNQQITQGAPPNITGLYQNARVSSIASDHFPVIVDLEMPSAVVLDSVSINGLDTITSGGFAQYQGVAHYSDGTQAIITVEGTWEVVSGPVQFLSPGLVQAQTVAFDDEAVIQFSYTSEEVTKDTQKTVAVLSACDRGDVDGNGSITARDIQPFVNVILGLETDPATVCRANIVNDGVIDESDLIALVDELLD